MRKTLAQRFWNKVDRHRPDDCWIWKASFSSSRYGQIQINGKPCGAHRVAYELTIGPIPHGLFVCHSCDNTACVNPSHLWLGTNADNIRDRYEKYPNSQRGEKHYRARLTAYDVREMRRAYAAGECTKTDIARRYKITFAHAFNIIENKRWKA